VRRCDEPPPPNPTLRLYRLYREADLQRLRGNGRRCRRNLCRGAGGGPSPAHTPFLRSASIAYAARQDEHHPLETVARVTPAGRPEVTRFCQARGAGKVGWAVCVYVGGGGTGRRRRPPKTILLLENSMHLDWLLRHPKRGVATRLDALSNPRDSSSHPFASLISDNVIRRGRWHRQFDFYRFLRVL
jgi:hypothetical protein